MNRGRYLKYELHGLLRLAILTVTKNGAAGFRIKEKSQDHLILAFILTELDLIV